MTIPAAGTLRTIDDLVGARLVAPDAASALDAVAARYAVAVSPAMRALIDPADPDDPIARQFVPSLAELDRTPGERADPIGDDAHSPLPGLVHRYPDRVLLKLASVCPVYCRFCFRRESVGQGEAAMLSEAEIAAALAYVAARPAIFEVIVTGGDPLGLSPRRIADVAARVGAIPHVAVLRWHSRVPVVAPVRIDGALVAALRCFPCATYVAVHANHPRELTPAADAALARLADAGIALLGQTVLLKGVNDAADTLAALFRGMVARRVKPYYLHHADLAPGTAHLRTTLAEGQALMRALRGRVSGLAQPTYVLDIPGGHGKVPVGPTYLDGAHVRDPDGCRHPYPPPAGPR